MTGSLTAQIVTETADAMVSTGLKDKGYEYVNLCVVLPSCVAVLLAWLFLWILSFKNAKPFLGFAATESNLGNGSIGTPPIS